MILVAGNVAPNNTAPPEFSVKIAEKLDNYIVVYDDNDEEASSSSSSSFRRHSGDFSFSFSFSSFSLPPSSPQQPRRWTSTSEAASADYHHYHSHRILRRRSWKGEGWLWKDGRRGRGFLGRRRSKGVVFEEVTRVVTSAAFEFEVIFIA
ncbi:hypothetical protein RND81_12G132200 [Saponaria officinalis]|uniref:Uncharacterized protein n=1 Tax=Saponaria officinalis TaxID=3572 RepID=A0AAW1HA38_SAPOF